MLLSKFCGQAGRHRMCIAVHGMSSKSPCQQQPPHVSSWGAHRRGGVAVHFAQDEQVGRLRVSQQVLHPLSQRTAAEARGHDKTEHV